MCDGRRFSPNEETKPTQELIDHIRLHGAQCTHMVERGNESDGGAKGEISQCKNLAIKNTGYCSRHIKYHPEVYEKFLESQNIYYDNANNSVAPTLAGNLMSRKPKYLLTKYNFIKKDLKGAYREYCQKENILDLKHEIALLSANLNRLCSTKFAPDATRSIELQIKLINQIRLLVKTIRELDEGRKITVSFNDLRIFMLNISDILKHHIQDQETLKQIGKQVYDLYATKAKETRPQDVVVEPASIESKEVCLNS